MTPKTFSQREAIGFGWNIAKSNLGFFLMVLVIVGLVNAVPEILRRTATKDAPLQAAFVALAFTVIQQVMSMGLIKISLRFCDNEKPELGDLFSQFPLFFRYLGASILYVLIVLGGFILLIVPGIIWAIQFGYVFNVVVDRGLRPVEALKMSSAITRGAKWSLLLWGIVLAAVNLLGVLALFVGLLWTIPTTLVASTYVYRKLLAQTNLAPAAAG